MLLYRADRKGNKTYPEKFHSDGLLTKQVNSGDDPRPHVKYGWLNTIKSHINPASDLEQFIYNTTAYLSGTSNFTVAHHYLKGKPGYNIIEAHSASDAQGYIFEFTLDDSSLKQIGKGLFLYSYKCNYRRGDNNVKFQSMFSQVVDCNICRFHPHYEHQLLVIDAARYLQSMKSLYAKEHEAAALNHEWLLLPMDPMPDGLGFQSRIPIADFWDVYFFKFGN